MKKYIYFFLLKFAKIHMQIDNELVAKKYSEGLDSILDLGKEFPDENVVQVFAREFAPLIIKAIKLRGESIDEKEYYKQAKELKIPKKTDGLRLKIKIYFKIFWYML